MRPFLKPLFDRLHPAAPTLAEAPERCRAAIARGLDRRYYPL